jgi:hypothetical protein
MDALPGTAKRCQVIEKHARYPGQVVGGKSVVLPQSDWTGRAIQLEDGFMSVPDHVHMRRTVVIGINGHPQRANPQNGWHDVILA